MLQEKLRWLIFRGLIKKNNIDYLPQPDLQGIKGQVRDLKWMHTAKFGDVLIVARNNDSLLFYAMKK